MNMLFGKILFCVLVCLPLVIQSCGASASLSGLQSELERFVEGKDARIGVAVIIDGRDTVSVNGTRDFPMMSVFKFPVALAVVDHCAKSGIALTDTLDIPAAMIRENTWSPLRERYGVADMRLSIDELLDYSLRFSDNNACDLLIDFVGGVATVDSLMQSYGFSGICISYNEDGMHRDPYLCYVNRSTPLQMASLFDVFADSMRCSSAEMMTIARMLETCDTGRDRLVAPVEGSGVVVGHKTGTGDRNTQGRLIGVNDCGYFLLPDGSRYVVAVFIADSAYGMDETSQLIARISEIVYNNVARE